MKRLRNKIDMKDRVVCERAEPDDRDTLRYWYVEARTGARYPLGEPFAFSMSVKDYFGGRGKTIRQLYDFDRWYNPRLEQEMRRISRLVGARYRERQLQPVQREICGEERAA